MNIKRYIGAALALFVFIFFYEWLVHGMLLKGIYQQTPQVWRDASQMVANMPFYIGFQLVVAAWLAFVFTQVFKEGGVAKGALFGLYFGIFAGLLSAAWYVWLPVSPALGSGWFVGSFVQIFLGGCILGVIYKPKRH